MEPASFGSIPPGNFVADFSQFNDSVCFSRPGQDLTWWRAAEEDSMPLAPKHEPVCWVGFSSSKVASVVRKTFIELDEPSPLAKSSRRSRSLPRSLGLSHLDEDSLSTCSDAIDLSCSPVASPACRSFEAPSEQWTALAEEIAASFEGHKAMSIRLSNLL